MGNARACGESRSRLVLQRPLFGAVALSVEVIRGLFRVLSSRRSGACVRGLVTVGRSVSPMGFCLFGCFVRLFRSKRFAKLPGLILN